MTDVPQSPATGWPTIDELATFAQASAADDVLQQCLDDAIDYGSQVLGAGYVGPLPASGHRAAMTYAATNFTERIANADMIVDALSGPTAMTRYRRSLLACRYTAFA